MNEAERILLRDLYQQEATHYSGLAATARKLAKFYEDKKPLVLTENDQYRDLDAPEKKAALKRSCDSTF